MRVTSVTVVDGQEVFGDKRTTMESIDFNQIGAFGERDLLRTSVLGNNLKDRIFRVKYVLALALLRVPRQGSGYERTLEDLLPN